MPCQPVLSLLLHRIQNIMTPIHPCTFEYVQISHIHIALSHTLTYPSSPIPSPYPSYPSCHALTLSTLKKKKKKALFRYDDVKVHGWGNGINLNYHCATHLVLLSIRFCRVSLLLLLNGRRTKKAVWMVRLVYVGQGKRKKKKKHNMGQERSYSNGIYFFHPQTALTKTENTIQNVGSIWHRIRVLSGCLNLRPN